MTELTAIWLPILLAGVACHIVSMLSWAASPHHIKDYKSLPDHNAFAAAIRSLGLPPGHYKFPHPQSQADFKTEAFKEAYANGPWGGLDLAPAKPNMGRNLGLTFGYFLLVSLFVGYLISESRAPGAEFLRVFQVGTTAAFMAYGLGGLLGHIWYPTISTRGFITTLIDAALYALATGAIFALMWPSAGLPASIPVG